MKTVFILGAGASAAAGAPVMANFLSRARQLHAAGTFAQHSAQFDDVIRAADSDLRGMYAKTHLQIAENIEELFSAVDMGMLIGRFGNRSPEQISVLRNSIVTFIYRTIEETILLSCSGGKVSLPVAYAEFADAILHELKLNAGRSINVSFLSFNYDVCLEYAFSRLGIGIDYCLKEPFAHSPLNGRQVNVPVLKLHGSINWGWCVNCKTIVPTNVDSRDQYILGDLPHCKLPVGSELKRYHHEKCGTMLYELPFIVPPTWDKSGSKEGDLAQVWRRAAKELSDADNIVVIGYSFPKTDSFFKYLYALGVNSDKRLNSVTVINGTDGPLYRDNFEQLKGAVSKSVFQYYDFVFKGSMHIIRQILGLNGQRR